MILRFQTCTISLLRAASSVLGWIWAFIKEPGGIVVLFGVVGELIFEYGKWPKDEKRRGKLKRSCGLLLVVGLAVEIPESARFHKLAEDASERAANTESNNLVLRSNVAALELKAMEASNNIIRIDPLNQPMSG